MNPEWFEAGWKIAAVGVAGGGGGEGGSAPPQKFFPVGKKKGPKKKF